MDETPTKVISSSSNAKPSSTESQSADSGLPESDGQRQRVSSESKSSSSKTRRPCRVCCVCGRELVTFRKYTKVTSEISRKLITLGSHQESIDFSSLKICLKCKGRVEKASDTEIFVKQALQDLDAVQQNEK